MRRIALLAAVALVACSNSKPVRRPAAPPVVSTTTINFSTYLGNDLADVVRDVAMDAAGNVFAVGGASSVNLLPGTPTRAHAGSEDAFVAKFDANGLLEWWTFLGGPGPDRGYAIEIDPTGDLVIGGSAANGFPVQPQGVLLEQFQGGAGACDPTQPAAECTVDTANPARDGFVAKLSGTNGALLWATYFGSGRFEADADVDPASGPDGVTDFNDDADPRTSVVRDVAVDPANGDIYLTFSLVTSSTRLITTPAPTPPNLNAFNRNLPPVIRDALENSAHPSSPPALDTGSSGTDALLAKLTPDGTALLWAAYVGGRGDESNVMLVRLDSQANPIVLLATNSVDRVTAQDPATKAVVGNPEPIAAGGFDTTLGGGADYYLAKFALDGEKLWSTYLGGSGTELIESANLVLRADDSIVIAAGTSSPDLRFGGGWDSAYNGAGGSGYFSADCLIALIAPGAAALQATTYYGGAAGDGCAGVAVDSRNRVYVTGGTSSLDLAIVSGPHQTSRPGARSAFLAVFSADLTQPLYSGYFGGSGLGNSNTLLVRPGDTLTSGRVVFAGESEAGYPLAPATPVRGAVTAPPAHGVLTDATLGF